MVGRPVPVLVLVSALAGCLSGQPSSPEPAGEGSLGPTDYSFSTTQAHDAFALELSLYGLEKGKQNCELLLAVAGGGSDHGSGFGSLLLIRQEHASPRWGGFRWYSLLPAVVAAGVDSEDVVSPLFDLVDPTELAYAKGWNFSVEAFGNAVNNSFLTSNVTLAVVGNNVRPWLHPLNRLEGDSVRLRLKCDVAVRYEVRGSTEVVLATHQDFEGGARVEFAQHAADVDRSRSLQFTAPDVEILAAGAAYRATDPVQHGSFKVTGPTEERQWDFFDPYPLYFHAGPGRYEFELDRVGRDLFFVVAIGWLPGDEFEPLASATEP